MAILTQGPALSPVTLSSGGEGSYTQVDVVTVTSKVGNSCGEAMTSSGIADKV